jgi:hypothetical protein
MNLIALPARPEPVPVAAVPDVAALVRSLGFLTPAEAARLDALERAAWVLVRNDGGERWRCDPVKGGCGRKHEYFTLHCIPRPWPGLTHGLFAYWSNLGGADPRDLSPTERARLASFAPRLADGQLIPSLAAAHPGAAKALATPKASQDYVAWALGSVVRIERAEAAKYAGWINAREHRTVIRV